MIKSIYFTLIFFCYLNIYSEEYKLPVNSEIYYLDSIKIDYNVNNEFANNDLSQIIFDLTYCMLEENDKRIISSFKESIKSAYIYNCKFIIEEKSYNVSLIKVEYLNFFEHDLLNEKLQNEMKYCIDFEKAVFSYIPIVTNVSNKIYFIKYNKTKYKDFYQYFWKYGD